MYLQPYAPASGPAAAVSPQIKSQVTQASYRVLREYPDYNSIIVAPPATQVEVASAPGSAAVTPEQVVSTLSVLPDAVAVTPNPKLSLIQPVRRAVSDADAQAVSQPAADRPGKVVTCPSNTWGLGPDEDLARNGTEGTPYGIKMVQVRGCSVVRHWQKNVCMLACREYKERERQGE